MSKRANRGVRSVLGQRLRQLRKGHGMSQERLGQRADLSGKFIGEVERGEKSISIDSLVRVAKALEVPLATLTSQIDRRVDCPVIEETITIVAGMARKPLAKRERLRRVVKELAA